MRFLKDLSVSAASAGFVAVLVGVTSSIVIVFQAAQALGASHEQITSWVWALGVGCGLCTAVPSLLLRQPVMVAWSTPGAAMLAVSGGGFSMGEAVGAFMLCAALVALFGVTGWFERIMDRIPLALAAGLLAGVLTRFGLQAFTAAQTALPLVLVMLSTYLLGRRLFARYAVPATLAVAVLFALASGRMNGMAVPIAWALAEPVWVTPQWSLAATVSLALPLFVVTMASQNLPGVAAIRAAGFRMPVSRLVTLTGLATLLLAPFGGYSLSLSAITASICMGREAHEDPDRRYAAAVVCGVIYLCLGLFAGLVTAWIAAFPAELVAAIAGLALLGTIGNGLSVALGEPSHREAALITFLVTLSGVTIAGIGSAFWGVAAGVLALWILHRRA
ncbi:benzoate membrane transport protein [Comamonas sp. BIGb0124]|uniref:benzoate/H(+) symporter BenE family transporter n=1 Tax=Comamonas sp. BIGb0124 TaxID=2485130 RepID=UPI000F46B84A|nr:benzoate/H(+) symporter BenE family transporter [Comamonas sp. BIGb0124]ROR22616.1 benzoate membrane transport protein [Comamonas sp. BIGb0124]